MEIITRGRPRRSTVPASAPPLRGSRGGRVATAGLLAAFLAVLAGCTGTHQPGSAADQADVQGTAPEGAAAVRGADRAEPLSLRCEPDELAYGDTLVLTMSHPHGPYLAVRAPDGTQFFLAYPTLGDTTAPPPIVSNEAFMQARELRLPTSEVISSPWTVAEIVPQHVFAAPGTYEITLAENLESDAEYPSVQCTVRYTGRAAG